MSRMGFFQIVGHGIPLDLMESMICMVNYFFSLPTQERMKYYSSSQGPSVSNTFRFSTSADIAMKNKQWCDYMFQACLPPPKVEDYPTILPGYRQLVSKYSAAVTELAMKILGILSENLGLEHDAIEKSIANPGRMSLKMNYYPPCPSPENAIGLDSHGDPGSITILQQEDGVEGLQILHNGKWVSVKPLPGALVVNVADQVEILTNGIYKSVKHRAAVNKSKPRISIAAFFIPEFDKYVAPLEDLTRQKAAVYHGRAFGDYLRGYLREARSVESLRISE